MFLPVSISFLKPAAQLGSLKNTAAELKLKIFFAFKKKERENPNSAWLFVQMGFDVFNALDLMENKQFLEKLKFGVGDGFLQYYLYNWRCPAMDAKKVSELLRCGHVFRALHSGSQF